MAYEGLIDNKNAEKWTFEEAQKFFMDAYEKSIEKKGDDYLYDFIGEIARELGQYKELFGYLVDKFPSLEKYYVSIKSNCEANCFYNGKKNNIVPSMAIMNLKSNHGWTDRAETTIQGGDKPVSVISLGNGVKPDETTT